MNTRNKLLLGLSCLYLVACAEQPTTTALKTKPAAQPQTVAAAKPSSSNVQISTDTRPHADVDGTYYVQNRILASGGAVSGAIMGS